MSQAETSLPFHLPRRSGTAVSTLFLLLFFTLAVTSLDALGPTFDEQGFLVRGLGYLRGDNRHMRVGHPLGLNALNAALLAPDESVRLPVNHPSWAETGFHRPAELFLWEIGNDVAHVLFLGRLPTVWVGMLLLALVGRWAGQLAGHRRAGWLAMGLLALDPNILAHTRLATTDLGLAAATAVSVYTLWYYWKRPSWERGVLAGAGFALLQNTKFTAGLFVPLLALVILIALIKNSPFTIHNSQLNLRPLLIFTLTFPLTALLALWAMYGFQVGALPDSLPTLPQLSGLTLPLAHHLEQLLDIGGRLQQGTPAFLMGDHSDSGWWYYFPVAFALKTPLPTLFLLGWAAVRYLRPRAGKLIQRDKGRKGERAKWQSGRVAKTQRGNSLSTFDAAALLLPALGYFAFALTTSVNLGYRHLLPILPLLYVFTAVTLTTPHSQSSIINYQLSILLLLLAATLYIHPHYLAYFNRLGGGPENGWRYLADSNIDWGQDLPNLADWMAKNEVEQVWLSYFGEGRPDYYGIDYSGLPSWPPRLMNPAAQPYYPHDPAPGVYAISATNLQGVHFADHDLFAWFREREPLAKIGYSIFIYEVEPYGETAHLALGGLQPDQIDPADYALLGTNDVIPHWFDPAHSLLWPAGERVWLALGKDAPGETAVSYSPATSAIANLESVVENEAYALYHLPSQPKFATLRTTFHSDSGAAYLILADWASPPADSSPEVPVFRTLWQKEAAPLPLKIFIHVTDEAGDIVAQWDGLGAVPDGWREGDLLWQFHPLPDVTTLPPGDYQVWAGLYHPTSGERWQTIGGDRLLLDEIEISR